MNKTLHKLYIATMVLIVIFTTIFIGISGFTYYTLPLEERFYHPQYEWFKPSGIFGQGLGVIGTAMIFFGVAIYILRKRYGIFKRFIRLKYLLEFHIFLCSLGPILVLFHTTFKFGGIVSIAFWSMVAIVLSGVIGRFIYIQIPRTIDGRELSLNEVKLQQNNLFESIRSATKNDERLMKLIAPEASNSLNPFSSLILRFKLNRAARQALSSKGYVRSEINRLIGLINEERNIKSKIDRLAQMQKLFQYWHVAHLPFALIMLLIVIVHVAVAVILGYKWIF